MSSPLQPLADYVVTQAEEPKNKTASGLFLPDNATEKPIAAKVLAVGDRVTRVKVGDRVVYKAYSTTELKINREEYIIVNEEDILAIVK